MCQKLYYLNFFDRVFKKNSIKENIVKYVRLNFICCWLHLFVSLRFERQESGKPRKFAQHRAVVFVIVFISTVLHQFKRYIHLVPLALPPLSLPPVTRSSDQGYSE
jgi:hypothetical protein